MSSALEQITDPPRAPGASEMRVLVFAPRKDAEMCGAILGQAGFDATVCAGLGQVAQELAAGAAALLLTEEALAPEQIGDLVAALAGQPQWSELPILLLTHDGAESQLAARATDNLDNVILLERPVQRLTLVSAVRSALKNRKRQYQLREYLAEQRRQQEALHASEQRLRATFENAASGIVEVDDKGRLIAVNDRICQMLGYAQEELLGKSVHELTYPEDRLRCDELNAQLLAGRISMFELEERCLKRDGSPLWVQVARSAVRDRTGRYLYSVATLVDVTARKQAELAVRESERRLHFVCESIPHLVWSARPDGYVDYMNQRVADYTGAKFDEIAGWDWLPFIHPEDRERTIQHWASALRDGSEVRLNYRMRQGKTGEYRWHAVHALPLRDDEGRIIRWYGTCTDIDEQQRTEEALRESEARLTLAQQAARIGAFQWDVQTGVNVWTPQLEAMYGLAPGEFGKTQPAWEQLVHPEDRAAAVERVNLALETGRPVEGEWRVIWRDGSVHWLMGRFQSVNDASGKPLRLSGVNIDITERKRTEEVLRQSEAQFRDLAEAIPEFAWITGPDGELEYVNKQWYQLTGAKPEETLGREWAEWLHPEDRERTLERWNHSVHTGESYEIEFRFRRASDGAYRWLLARGVPVRDEQGRIIRWFGTCTDIDDQKQAEERLEERVRQRTVDLAKALAEAEQGRATLDALLESIPEGITVADARDCKLRRASRYMGQMLGVDSRTLEGATADEYLRRWEIFEADGVTPVRNEDFPMVQSMREGITLKGRELLLRRGADEAKVPILCNAAPILDSSGQITGGVAAWRDITERKQAEAMLRESEQRLRLAQQAARIGSFDWDIQTNINTWSPELEAMYGLRPGEFGGTGTAFEQLVHPEDRESTLALVNRAFETDEPVEGEWRVRWPDGSMHWILGRFQVLKDAAGQPLRMTGVNLDITARKTAEGRLAADLAALTRLHTLSTRVIEDESLEAVLREIVDAAVAIISADKGSLQLFDPESRTLRIVAHHGHEASFLEFFASAESVASACGESMLRGERIIVEDVQTSRLFAGTPSLEVLRTDGVRAVQSTPLLSRDGEFLGVLSTHWTVPHLPHADDLRRIDLLARQAADLIEHKRSEAALRESEGNLQDFLSTAATGLVRNSRDLRYVSVNPAYAEIAGRPVEQIIGRSVAEVMGEEALAKIRPYIERVLGGERVEYEAELTFADTGPRWIHAIYTPDRDAAGSVIGWIGSITDITKRKHAEQALRESASRLKLAQQAAGIGAFEWNVQTGANVWTPELEAMYGLQPGQFGGTQTAWEQLIHPEDRAAAVACVNRAFETFEPIEGEWRVVWPDGSVRWLIARFQVFKDAAGKPLYLSGVHIDITPRKQAEAALRELNATLEHRVAERTEALQAAKAEAERANAAKDQFLAVLSHELRTPLTPVLAAIALMKREGNLQAKELSHLDLIKRNVSVEARLIDDLLDLTRIVRGKISLEKVPINICEVLAQVQEVCRPDIETRRLHFGINLEKAPYLIYADASRLQQVFWNLVKNAIKFTPEGGCVGIWAYAEGDNVIVEVNDSGIGIEPEMLPKIFDAFEQGAHATTRQFGGLGLGLAITKRLVDMHGGSIAASSKGKGHGSTFRVVLPLMKEVPSMKDTAKEERLAHVAKRILLVEDHGDTAQLMRMLLEGLGHDVEVAGDAAEALKAASQKDFDLLISDLGLPDKSGTELMQELHKKGILVTGIAVSGYGREEDVRRSKDAGFIEHLTKPVDFDLLERTVERVVRHSPMPEQSDEPPRL